MSDTPAYSTTVDALRPEDPRVQHLDAEIGAYNYHYMLATPAGKPRATVLLLHGFPDLGMAWRYQVPYLMSLGLRVIVPDMLGYGRTSAPAAYEAYTLRRIAYQMRDLVAHVVGDHGEQVILGGHDWGAAAAWRMAMWCPEVVRAVFSFNVAYTAPLPRLIDGEELARRQPSFRYQLQLASPEAERMVDASPARLRGFINGMYGGTGPDGAWAFSPDRGVLEEHLDDMGPAKLMGPDMVDYYCREYARHGLHGPTNWYRTRRLNYEDELPFVDDRAAGRPGWRFACPAMVVMAEKDIALPPRMADGTERFFEGPGGLRKEVAKGVGHWGMWQDPRAFNEYIGSFVEDVLGGGLKEKL